MFAVWLVGGKWLGDEAETKIIEEDSDNASEHEFHHTTGGSDQITNNTRRDKVLVDSARATKCREPLDDIVKSEAI